MQESYRDPDRDVPLGQCDQLEEQPLPTKIFNLVEPTWVKTTTVVGNERSVSAPSGLGYTAFKKCPKLLQRLYDIIKIIWRKGKIPPGWQRAEGCFVPKEEDSEKLNQYRSISLLSIEGKIFFALVSKRITELLWETSTLTPQYRRGYSRKFRLLRRDKYYIPAPAWGKRGKKRTCCIVVRFSKCAWFSCTCAGR